MLRMGFQAGIIYTFDHRMVLKILCNFKGAFAVLFNADIQRFESAVYQKRLKRAYNGAVMSLRPNMEHSAIKSTLPAAMPAITSPWPFKYFVAL